MDIGGFGIQFFKYIGIRYRSSGLTHSHHHVGACCCEFTPILRSANLLYLPSLSQCHIYGRF